MVTRTLISTGLSSKSVFRLATKQEIRTALVTKGRVKRTLGEFSQLDCGTAYILANSGG
jgi:hypothetical protein